MNAPIIKSPALLPGSLDYTEITSPNLNLVIQTPPTAVFVQAVVQGEQAATFQSNLLLFTPPYISGASDHFFSLDIALGAKNNTVIINYFNTYPSDTPANLASAKSPDAEIRLFLDQTSSLITPPAPPSGFDIAQRAVEVRVTWDKTLDDDYIGSNFYLASSSGGPYYKVNTALLTALDPSSTTNRLLFNIPISALPAEYVGTADTAAQPFYAVATNVIQAQSGIIMESPYSMEFEIKFYNFPTIYTSPLNRSQQEVQVSLLNSIHSYDLQHDLKPGSILQDVFVNPVSTELARVYQRMHFYHYAGFISTLLKYEDENGDGFTDTLAQSPLRQTLQQAFSLSSATEVQNWIDDAFDRLASKFYAQREGSKSASGRVTFYTKAKPTQTIVIPLGTIVSSESSLLSGATPVSYVTTETGSIPLDSIGSYYNADLARWELQVSVVAQQAGSAGNASAGTVSSVSGLPGSFKVVNELNLFGGADAESNLNLAARLRNTYLSRDPGRRVGIQAWMSKVPGIYSCKVVAASDKYMMRDYDSVRKLHVYGRADAYVDSRASSEKTQTLVVAPVAISSLDATTTVTASNITSSDWAFTIQDYRLTSETPVYQVLQVRNVSKSIDYNISTWSSSLATTGSITIHLDPSLQTGLSSGSVTPSATDTLQIIVRILSNTGFEFNYQPVLSVNSLEGEDISLGGAGSIDVSSTLIVETQDPLGIGGSVRDDKRLYIIPKIESHIEPFTFPSADPLNPSAPIIYTASTPGVVPFSVGVPTLVDTLNPSLILIEGTHYTLQMTDDQRLRVIKAPALSSIGAYELTYQAYQVFPRKFKVIAEPLVLSGTTPTYLMNVGVNPDPSTLVVHTDILGTNTLVRGVHYSVTPYDDTTVVAAASTSGSSSPYDSDYWAASPSLLSSLSSSQASDLTSATGIINSNLALLPDGSTVYVDYEYYENITCKYSVDQGVIDAQAYADTQKNCTMNLLVKRCNYVPVTLELTVTLATGADQATVENSIRTQISNLFNNLSVGDGIHEVNIIRAATSVSGVSNLQIPLNRMSFADGAHINQENLPTWALATDLIGVPSTSAPIYKCNTQSLYASLDGGGNWWQYVSVYEDGIALDRSSTQAEFISNSPGSNGTFLLLRNPVTYTLDVYIKPNRTSEQNSDINSHVHTLTYYVYGDSSTHDIPGMDLSILTLGTLSLKFVE